MDMDNYCRACLKRAERFSHFIYKHISAKQYSFCTSIEVKREDGLPKAICDNCFKQINEFIQFKSRCIRSEISLLKFLDGSLIKDEPCPELKEIVVQIKDTNEELATKEEIKSENKQIVGETQSNLKTEIDNTNEDGGEEVLNNCHDDVSDSQTDFLSGIEEFKDHVETNSKSLVKPGKSNQKTVKVRDKLYNCDQCNRKYLYEQHLENHRKRHHSLEVSSFECETCNKTFLAKWSLRKHIKENHTNYSFKDVTCQICSKVFKTPGTLRSHQKTHEHRQGRVCEECGKVLKSDYTFKNHLETHIKNRERNFPCKHCDKKYMNKKGCAKHIARRHANKQFICNYCGYVFTEKPYLASHIMLHEGTHPKYKCDICSRLLTSKPSLLKHKRIHTGEKPFSCKYCSKSFSDKACLVEHERNHTGEKPFECVVCSMKFSRRGSMKRHMKVHYMWEGCKKSNKLM